MWLYLPDLTTDILHFKSTHIIRSTLGLALCVWKAMWYNEEQALEPDHPTVQTQLCQFLAMQPWRSCPASLNCCFLDFWCCWKNYLRLCEYKKPLAQGLRHASCLTLRFFFKLSCSKRRESVRPQWRAQKSETSRTAVV